MQAFVCSKLPLSTCGLKNTNKNQQAIAKQDLQSARSLNPPNCASLNVGLHQCIGICFAAALP